MHVLVHVLATIGETVISPPPLAPDSDMCPPQSIARSSVALTVLKLQTSISQKRALLLLYFAMERVLSSVAAASSGRIWCSRPAPCAKHAFLGRGGPLADLARPSASAFSQGLAHRRKSSGSIFAAVAADTVLHLASMIDAVHGRLPLWMPSTWGTDLVTLCKRCGVQRLIYLI